MKRITLLFAALVALSGTAVQADPSPVAKASLADAASQAQNYILTNWTGKGANSSFWVKPDGDGAAPWEGAQALESVIINYEATQDPKYLAAIQNYSDWMLNSYTDKSALTDCETWPSYDITANKGVGNSPNHPSWWSDDAGWVINTYLQFYKYTSNKRYLDVAYQTFMNCDARWGVDFKANSRGLRYYDHLDHYAMYMTAVIIGGLTLYEDYHAQGDQTKADQCFAITSKYYNFVENYLHSSGPGKKNITGAQFTMAKDLYQIAAWFHAGDLTPAPDAVSHLGRGHFTACHMMMAAVYMMMDSCCKDGANISGIDKKFRNFHKRAIAAADAFVRPYPLGYLEPGTTVNGSVIVNACDPNVNGFGCYWWTEYIVPLNPKKYGAPLLRTAQSIVDHQGTGELSSSLWNSPPTLQGKDLLSNSTYAGSPGWRFVRGCSACTILAAANWIEKMYGLTE